MRKDYGQVRIKSFLVTPKVEMDLYKSKEENSICSSFRPDGSKGSPINIDMLDEECNFKEKYYILVDGSILQYGHEMENATNQMLQPEAIL